MDGGARKGGIEGLDRARRAGRPAATHTTSKAQHTRRPPAPPTSRNDHRRRRLNSGWEADYPLFTTVNRIVTGAEPPGSVTAFPEVGARPLPGGGDSGDGDGLPLAGAARRVAPVLSTAG